MEAFLLIGSCLRFSCAFHSTFCGAFRYLGIIKANLKKYIRHRKQIVHIITNPDNQHYNHDEYT